MIIIEQDYWLVGSAHSDTSKLSVSCQITALNNAFLSRKQNEIQAAQNMRILYFKL